MTSAGEAPGSTAVDEVERCADTARTRQDPPLGTTPLTLRWLLIEHPGPWRTDAVAGAGWPAGVGGALSRIAHASRARILLIRRPGRTPRGQESRAWAVSFGDTGTVWGRWRSADDLLEAGRVLEARPPALAVDLDPVLLVCVHGIHDACCAMRGRPVAAALAERWPEQTWECSHVGGCRFAANVIVLPDGAYYGNLEPARAVDVVHDHLGGRMAAGALRGLARHPPVAQIAVGLALERWGPFAAHAVRVRRIEQMAPDAWEVDLVVPGRPAVRVSVRTSARPPARLTCRAPQATSAVAYEVANVRDLAADLT